MTSERIVIVWHIILTIVKVLRTLTLWALIIVAMVGEPDITTVIMVLMFFELKDDIEGVRKKVGGL